MSRRGRGHILIVEDDEAFLETVMRPVFAPTHTLECAYNARQAHDALDHAGHLDLAVIDLNIPGGEVFSIDQAAGGGFDIARRVRDEFPSVLCAIVTAYITPVLVNAAQLCGAEFVSKENCQENLEALRERVVTRSPRPVGTEALAAWPERVAAFAKKHRLSARQTQVLELAVLGHSYRDIAGRMGVTPNTVKSHSRNVLSKSGFRSIKDIVAAWTER